MYSFLVTPVDIFFMLTKQGFNIFWSLFGALDFSLDVFGLFPICIPFWSLPSTLFLFLQYFFWLLLNFRTCGRGEGFGFNFFFWLVLA